jgi:hypothetical protein
MYGHGHGHGRMYGVDGEVVTPARNGTVTVAVTLGNTVTVTHTAVRESRRHAVTVPHSHGVTSQWFVRRFNFKFRL